MRRVAYSTVVEAVAAELMVDVCDVIALVDLTPGSPCWADMLEEGARDVAHECGGLWIEGGLA